MDGSFQHPFFSLMNGNPRSQLGLAPVGRPAIRSRCATAG
jgi:hypothetical protein